MDDHTMNSLLAWCREEATHGDCFNFDKAAQIYSALEEFVIEYPDLAARYSWREMQDTLFCQKVLAGTAKEVHFG